MDKGKDGRVERTAIGSDEKQGEVGRSTWEHVEGSARKGNTWKH